MKKTTIMVFLVVWMLTSCAHKESIFIEIGDKAVEENNSFTDENGCIQPTINYAYGINLPSEDELDSFPKFILPDDSWVRMAHFPEGLASGDIVFVYQNEEELEVWIKGRRQNELAVNNLNYNANFSSYWIYSAGSNEWQMLSATTGDGEVMADYLFTGWDGNLYAVNLPITESGDPFPLLSKFDRSSLRFESIEQSIEITREIVTEPYDIIPLVNSKGYLWLIVVGDGIYSYTVSMNAYDKQFDFSNELILEMENYEIPYANVGADDKIYYLFSEPVLNYGEKAWPLYTFDTNKKSSGRILPYLVPWPFRYTSFLGDTQGNIWFDNAGWLGSDENWYQLVPSSIFIGFSHDVYTSRLSPAKVLLESEDQILWFHHENGMMYLDPSEEKWCWFTTYQSNIIEDPEGDLWMIADGKLYKRPVIEK
ncbi:MAG: hypothetical protein JEZ00_07080 [Anaerolineaceae bacterium]|nr:hypothetical protein [Anaerolineaceae bacterium]